MVLAIERTQAFQDVMAPALETVDYLRAQPLPGERKRRGRAPSFFALDYFRLEALRRCLGKKATQETRDWLTSDKATDTRRLLDFDRDRAHFGGKARRWMVGIPSDGWMSSFRTRWLTEEHFALLWQDMQRQVLREVLQTIPGMREEARTLFADGSLLVTHAMPPKYDPRTRAAVNADQVTAPSAGYVPNTGRNENHCGSGWNIILLMTSRGTVVGSDNVALNTMEFRALEAVIPGVVQTLDENLGGRDLRVLSADSGFNSHGVRSTARAHGIIENIQPVSHANSERSRRNAAARNRDRFAVQDHPNWQVNGHRELGCVCGQGKVSRRVSLNANGKSVTRVQGECRTCGSVTLTSGSWRVAKNPKQFVRFAADLDKDGVADTGAAAGARDKPDLALGNPLTFNDKLAKQYGSPRFHGQEGVFGSQLTQRFQLLKGKRWFYRQSQVDLEVAMVITITHALRLERWRRMHANGAATDQAIHASDSPQRVAA